jgi:hypothetical protein
MPALETCVTATIAPKTPSVASTAIRRLLRGGRFERRREERTGVLLTWCHLFLERVRSARSDQPDQAGVPTTGGVVSLDEMLDWLMCRMRMSVPAIGAPSSRRGLPCAALTRDGGWSDDDRGRSVATRLSSPSSCLSNNRPVTLRKTYGMNCLGVKPW